WMCVCRNHWCLFSRCDYRCCFLNALHHHHLHRTRDRIHRKLTVLRPTIGIIVMSYIEQHIHITTARFEDNTAPVVIDAHRLQVAIACAMNVLVVDSWTFRVCLELNGPLHDLGMHV